MQAEQVQVLVQQAAAGNVDAFVTLIQTYGHGLRVALAAHLEHPGAISPVEIAVWSAVRQRLGEWLSDTPFPTWVQEIAVELVHTHLNQADRRAIDIQDALTHHIIEHCRQALADGGELGVTGLGPLVQALPEASRQLLGRRYRERQRTSAIATSLMISEAEVATSLMAARAACDWRQIARPPAPTDRLLPPLIEDWLSGTIDVDSRSLLATNLGRDLDKAAQFARQVRIHLALGALLVPFTRDDASTLARQSGMGMADSGRVMMGEAPRSSTNPRSTTHDSHRPIRGSVGNREPVIAQAQPPSASPLPWIVGGALVVVGIIALVVNSRGGRNTTVIRVEEPVTAPVVTTTITPPPAPNKSAAGSAGGVLRLEPGRSAPVQERPATPPVLSLTGSATLGQVCNDTPLELRASLSHIVGVKAVEFYNGNQRLGSVEGVPFIWTWEQPTPGTAELSARALGVDGVLSMSQAVRLDIHPALGTGRLRREWWNGTPGIVVADGMSVPGFPDRPHGADEVDSFAAPRDTNDHYLQRLRGYVLPPLDGAYTFWIAADDEAQLWLSTDDNRANLRLIAKSPAIIGGGIGYGDWDHDEGQRSAPIHLRRGQRCYIEALHKEGDGNDHVEVGWQLPNGQLQRPIPGHHLTPANDVVPAPATPGTADQAPPSVPAATRTLVRSIDFVSSGAPYVISQNLNGDRAFIDRDWRLKRLPPELASAQLIRTRNNDDRVTSNPHLKFTVDVPVEVYLALAVSGTTTPSWMQGWTRTEVVMELDGGPSFRLHRATFPAGQITLGGNEREATGATDNYMVLVVPLAAPPAPLVWKTVRAINLGGDSVEADGVKFLGQRQAESEGQTPPGTNQPGPWLSDLPWRSATTGHAQVRRNRSVDDKPLTVAGKVYEHGIGTHAPSEIVYDLGGRFSGLAALVGIDDEAIDEADVSFQVFGDGQKLFDSGSMRRGAIKPLAVPLTGVKELKLVVDANNNPSWDHSDWIAPQLLRPGGNDGVLMLRQGRRVNSSFSPKPAVDPKLRSVLGSAVAGTKDGLEFAVRVPNGPCRVYVLIGEPGVGNSRQFDLMVEGATRAGVGLLPANGWEKLGPIEVEVADGTIDVRATAIKGVPQVMGIIIEQPASTTPEKP